MKPEAKFIFQKDEHIHSYNLYSTRKAYIIYLSLQKKKLRMQGNQPTDLVISSRLLDLAHPNCSMGLGGHTMGAFTSYDQVPFPIFSQPRQIFLSSIIYAINISDSTPTINKWMRDETTRWISHGFFRPPCSREVIGLERPEPLQTSCCRYTTWHVIHMACSLEKSSEIFVDFAGTWCSHAMVSSNYSNI